MPLLALRFPSASAGKGSSLVSFNGNAALRWLAKLPAAAPRQSTCLLQRQESRLRRLRYPIGASKGTFGTKPDASPFIDYYRLLCVGEAATPEEIKRAYRFLQKRCHPDISGNELGHTMAVLLNEAQAILLDPKRRYVFDQARKFELESEGYTGHALSRWSGPASETRALFVDEGQCVGCLKCALEAPSSFSIEMQFGKARVVQQWADAEDKLKAAVSVCPVSCIHWVGRSDLPALEYVMRRDMKSAQGKTRADPFGSAAKFTRRRGAAQSPPEATTRAAWDPANAFSAIRMRAEGGSSSWWHLTNREANEAAQSVAIVPTDARSARVVVDGDLLEYLMSVSLDRKGASDHGNPARGLFLDNDEYWERPDPTPQAVPGFPSVQRQEIEPQSIREFKHQANAPKRDTKDVRAVKHDNLALLAMALIVVLNIASSHPNLDDYGRGPVSAQACYQRGGGLCRLYMH